ncbi:helix-turn-helix transcriptional regulator [Streptomyces sp. NBC_00237]|uniref:helix-turn-helix domain-containing protein n=1 Tax=Streptomyces sp. NBC_00237 TaxID=2975687 RepID=UPI00224E3A87|nr:helix-turn-helix transcriptional regulator [Streptomyces sp. NBC_00237]MCX5201468.1 helix-turn-helix transcriptional regulator [Streptomyces sp. NBC_00237]
MPLVLKHLIGAFMEIEQAGEEAQLTPRERFGSELVSDRTNLDLSQAVVAKEVRTSRATISRLEQGTGTIPQELPSRLDKFFGTDGKYKRLHEETLSLSFPALYRRRMALEKKAIEVREWSPTVIPGLVQTGRYALAVLRAGDPRASEREISAKVGSRLARQDVLRSVEPPELSVILCESVIRRVIGSPDVMREQLSALLDHGGRPTTRVQILPLDAPPHLLIEYATSLITGPNHATVVAVETYRTAGIIEDPGYVHKAVAAYAGIAGEALSAGDSADLIREQMERL